MTEETKNMESLTSDHKDLFNSWNSLRELADSRITEIQTMKTEFENQLKAKSEEYNEEARVYVPILKALEQKKSNVEAEMHDAEIPFPNMTLETSDLTTAVANFLEKGTTEPIVVNHETVDAPEENNA